MKYELLKRRDLLFVIDTTGCSPIPNHEAIFSGTVVASSDNSCIGSRCSFHGGWSLLMHSDNLEDILKDHFGEFL